MSYAHREGIYDADTHMMEPAYWLSEFADKKTKPFTTPLGAKHPEALVKAEQALEVDRPANVADIEEALAHGDLRENAEYHAAKERQGLLDAEMRILKDKIGRAQVIEGIVVDANGVPVRGVSIRARPMPGSTATPGKVPWSVPRTSG